MRKTLLVLALAAPLAGNASGSPLETLNVVTTIPDLADVVREIGGDRVDVRSIARGPESIHTVRTKPSHIVALSRADAFFEMGLAMEHAWVPGLLMTARNKRIQTGGAGFVNVSEGWTAREVPAELSRRQGTDLHPMGNPHFNLDPAGGRHIAGRVLAALVKLAPDSTAYFEERHAAYTARLSDAEERWAKIGARFRGQRVVQYHKDLDYLLAAYGIESLGTLESKPGVPPTPAHLGRLIESMRAQEVTVILTAPWSNNKHVDKVARETGARVVELPDKVGSLPGADSWIAMMDTIHARLADAFGLHASGD